MNRHTVQGLIFTWLFIIILSCFGCGFSARDVEVTLDAGASATEAEQARIAALPGGRIGYVIYDLAKHKTVRSHLMHSGFIPASTTKIFTTLAALEVLGPEFRFETNLLRTGSVRDGVLTGDLILKGGGDPTLAASDLMQFADRLEEMGVRVVDGRFLYDEGALQSVTAIDPAMEPDVSFNPGIGALSFEYNTMLAAWKKNKTELIVWLIPDLPMHRIAVAGKPLGENIDFSHRFADGIDTWLISPDIKKTNGSERLPVKRPGLYAAEAFAALCGMRGIRLPAPQAAPTPSGASTIATHESAPLVDLADIALTYSVNMMTENMLMATARKIAGTPLPLKASAEKIVEYYKSRLPNLKWDACRLVNGSGLTPQNRITPGQMAAMLIYADGQDYAGRRFRHMLPASGWEWSLMSRLNDATSAMRVWAKTGTINYALALAGYLYTASGRQMAFAIFASDEEARGRYDADPNRRGKESAGRVNAWQKAARNIMDDIVAGWIRDL